MSLCVGAMRPNSEPWRGLFSCAKPKNASLAFCDEVSSFAQTPQCEAATNIEVAVRAASPAPRLTEGPKAMQVPSILQGESRTRLIQGMVIGAVASMVIGFS
jgi:hypothetical protein